MFNFIKDNLFLWFVIFLIIVVPSFVVGAVEVIAYLILGIIILALVTGVILRWKLRKIIRENSPTGGQRATRSSRADDEGDVKVFRTTRGASATDKRVANDVGDYVDFEEVKDK